MNVLYLLVAGITIFALGSRYYGGLLSRLLGVDDERPTPAIEINDGTDYVPTSTPVLFAHHFSAIAGAGPILGPSIAMIYGYGATWLWIVFGGIFIGSVHDFTSLFMSIREDGKSMSEIARKALGEKGFFLFILFSLLMIILVTSAFLKAASMSLVSEWPVTSLGLTADHTFLNTVEREGVTYGIIGGIASTSVIIITLFSPVLGYLIYKRGIRVSVAFMISVTVCIGSIFVGIWHPVRLDPNIWMGLLTFYVFLAAGLPVWVVLQPRDFINVQILYVGIFMLIVGLSWGGLTGMTTIAPAFNVAEGTAKLGFIWPMLFVTVACGAISGFHSMVACGTTAKQINSERSAKTIGYNGMLLESVLALCVVLTIAGGGLGFDEFKSIIWPAKEGVKSNPILAFSLSMAHMLHNSMGIRIDLGAIFGILLVEGFVVTTLDSAVRLNRYMFEELWNILFKGNTPGIMKHYLFNSGLSVILMWLLAYYNAFTAIWPIFGTGNQLLAALSLIAATFWLIARGRKYFFVLLPAIFMMVTTTGSLIILLNKYISGGKTILAVADVMLLILSAGVVILAVFGFRKKETA